MFVKNMLIEDNLIVGTGWQRMELSGKQEASRSTTASIRSYAAM